MKIQNVYVVLVAVCGVSQSHAMDSLSALMFSHQKKEHAERVAHQAQKKAGGIAVRVIQPSHNKPQKSEVSLASPTVQSPILSTASIATTHVSSGSSVGQSPDRNTITLIERRLKFHKTAMADAREFRNSAQKLAENNYTQELENEIQRWQECLAYHAEEILKLIRP